MMLLLAVTGEASSAQQPDIREWYQRGEWPLLGAISALVVTQLVVMFVAMYNARAALRREVNLRRISACSEKLAGFYNPLYSMCLANGRMFDGFGPPTFPDDHLLADVAVQQWQRVRSTIVLPNNEAMLAVLRDKSHLLCETDDLSHYGELMAHLMAYRLFVENPTEKQSQFRFPKSIVGHLDTFIQRLRAELLELKK